MTLFSFDENPELNITPLVDIMLVLLAILMVTAPTITYEENIVLPKGTQNKAIQEASKIEVRVDVNRVIYVKDSRYDFKDFVDNFELISKDFDKGTSVYIRADKNLKYEDVMTILKAVKEIGFTRVSLVTDG